MIRVQTKAIWTGVLSASAMFIGLGCYVERTGGKVMRALVDRNTGQEISAPAAMAFYYSKYYVWHHPHGTARPLGEEPDTYLFSGRSPIATEVPPKAHLYYYGASLTRWEECWMVAVRGYMPELIRDAGSEDRGMVGTDTTTYELRRLDADRLQWYEHIEHCFGQAPFDRLERMANADREAKGHMYECALALQEAWESKWGDARVRRQAVEGLYKSNLPEGFEKDFQKLEAEVEAARALADQMREALQALKQQAASAVWRGVALD